MTRLSGTRNSTAVKNTETSFNSSRRAVVIHALINNMSAHDTQPLGVPSFHDVLPKYMSAFGRSIHAYLDELPAPADRAEPYENVSALIQPFREDDTAHSYKDEDASVDGMPVHLRDHDAFRTRMRCEVWQSTINALERKPWAQESDRDDKLSQHYSKMRHVAIKA